ncbi:DUF1989 domain-containing protein [Chthonobacter albigriseus]|uniref:DUF1989 domain-containing protein n=1 Tax=Chthonobacter albigriseus TaxID=1683161 RepID=UPI0015EFB54D|nr:urea carboxylase-associated family protein [Chthonobacter albigriseus]
MSATADVFVPGGHGRGFAADEGDLVTIVDVEGQQALDFVAVAKADLSEGLSGVETRRKLRSLYIKTGDKLYTSAGRPMFEVVEDSIGVHDYTVPACDPSRYAVDFGCPGHRNCLDNMFEALQPYGLPADLDVPEPFNFFQNSPVVEGGRTGVVDPPSRPGDKLVLRALMDVYCAVSSCPQDIIPGNGLVPSALEVHVRPAEGFQCRSS